MCKAGEFFPQVRERVPRKQGLKREENAIPASHVFVRERVPRKQGLKPGVSISASNSSECPRASSTKTRIETFWKAHEEFSPYCPRASSTKTRIETGIDHGLPPSMAVRERVPRKQGLKPIWGRQVPQGAQVRERVPRKQGLKPNYIIYVDLLFLGPRASSTKTRIETGSHNSFRTIVMASESEFHENKD